MLAIFLFVTAAPLECDVFDRFDFAGGESERSAVAQAVDTALQPMFFAVRAVAKRKISAGTHVSSRLAFHLSPDGQLVSEAEGTKTSASDTHGTPSYFLFDGSRVTLEQHADSARIRQTFTTRSGSRENIYDLSPDRKTLAVSVTISAPQLPRPVRYRLTYTRNPQTTCTMTQAPGIAVAGK